jgi:hypothetical protein
VSIKYADNLLTAAHGGRLGHISPTWGLISH